MSQKDYVWHCDPQDLFGLGTDDKHIAIVDADGVALAAIQGLNHNGGRKGRARR